MIIKSFELNKLNNQNSNTILLYGENEGFKNQVIKEYFINKYNNKIIERYEETEVLDNYENFISNLLNKSFFDDAKIIIISRTSDKILRFVEEIISKNIQDILLILNSASLEKKSKLRNYFEKEKNLVCIPFYSDNINTLNSIAIEFFKKKKVGVSREVINIITERCNGDRKNLNNELNKIENYLNANTKISLDEIEKLTNLSENYSITELADNCLSRNAKKTIKILNENNFSSDDCIRIARTLLLKSKRVLKLKIDCDNGKNIDDAISSYKPTIFWKDKIIVKNQILSWEKKEAEKLIKKISDIELLIKKNSINSLSIVSDFILNTANKN